MIDYCVVCHDIIGRNPFNSRYCQEHRKQYENYSYGNNPHVCGKCGHVFQKAVDVYGYLPHFC